MKRITIALMLAIVASMASINAAMASTPPGVVAKQLYRDTKPEVKKAGGHAKVDSIRCRGPVEPTVYICTIHSTSITNTKLCNIFYIAYRPGYHVLPYLPQWRCGTKPTALPAVPPKGLFSVINPNLPGA